MEGGGSWFEYWTEDGRPYYHNFASGATQWDRPPEFSPAAPSQAAGGAASSSVVDLRSEGGARSTAASDIAFSDGLGSSGRAASGTAPSGSIDAAAGRKGPAAEAEGAAARSSLKLLCCNLEFVKSFFDTTTSEVCHRVLLALFPFKPLMTPTDPGTLDFKARPDWYGALWISTTLVLSVFATASYAEYFYHRTASTDFRFLGVAAAVIYGSLFFLPAAGLLLIKLAARPGETNGEPADQLASVTITTMISVYGYSLLPYIPISIFCMIPSAAAKWAVAAVALFFAVAFSAVCLARDVERAGQSALRYVVFGYTVVSQLAVFLVFRLYFYHVPS